MTIKTPNDQWLDAVLRAPHVDDDGFVDSVNAALPTATAPSSASWRRRGLVVATGVMATVVGGALGAEALSQLQAPQQLNLTTALLLSTSVLMVLAAALSGEGLHLRPTRLRLAAGHSSARVDVVASGVDGVDGVGGVDAVAAAGDGVRGDDDGERDDAASRAATPTSSSPFQG